MQKYISGQTCDGFNIVACVVRDEQEIGTPDGWDIAHIPAQGSRYMRPGKSEAVWNTADEAQAELDKQAAAHGWPRAEGGAK